MKKILILLGLLLTIVNCAIGSNNSQLCYSFNPEYTKIFAFPANETYTGVPALLSKSELTTQIRDGYCPKCTLKNKADCAKYTCQKVNIKKEGIYNKIEVGSNKWMKMANKVALDSVKHGGGPFGAVVVQIDDKTGRVIRYWKGYNHVTQWNDPTAHAEIVSIREATHQLGVFDLGHIKKNESKLPQPGATSHVEIYSSAEPCPMCMAAIYWARIPTLVFSATRFDAAQPGVDFSDQMIYDELKLPYPDRKYMKVYQATAANSLDAFNLWKRTSKVPY